MKYRIDLHFTATISKTVDVKDENTIVDEKQIFFDEYEMSDVVDSLTYYDWDAIKEE